VELQFVKDYLDRRVEEGELGSDIAESIGVSTSMVSSYRNHKYNPSISVAKRVYTLEGITLHPFSEASLILEIERDNK
jgi:transcriptional regulator with XRE-family HTH domain